MKFKDLLFEDKNNLSTVLSEFQMGIPPGKLLYRGSNVDIGDWKVRYIRKDRKPRDTHEYLQKIFDLVAEKMYLNVPKRSESKFAANSVSEAERYAASMYDGSGGSVKVVFPEKGVNVASFESDTLTLYFGAVESYFNQIDWNLDSKVELTDNPIGKNQKLYHKFIDLALEVFDRKTHKINEFVEIIKNHGDEIKKYASREKIKHEKLGNKVLGAINTIEAYFEEMKSDISGSAEEVLFGGDKYLAIEKEFFEKNFEFDGKWQIE